MPFYNNEQRGTISRIIVKFNHRLLSRPNKTLATLQVVYYEAWSPPQLRHSAVQATSAIPLSYNNSNGPTCESVHSHTYYSLLPRCSSCTTFLACTYSFWIGGCGFFYSTPNTLKIVCSLEERRRSSSLSLALAFFTSCNGSHYSFSKIVLFPTWNQNHCLREEKWRFLVWTPWECYRLLSGRLDYHGTLQFGKLQFCTKCPLCTSVVLNHGLN
jgi:hypothetical protein